MNELPSTAIGTLRLFASTQTQIDVFSDAIINSVKEGEANPLEVLIQIRALQKVSDRVLKEINDNILKESDKYHENSFEFMGSKVEKAELGTKYDYSVCGDPVFERLEVDALKANADLKERQEFLKTLKSHIVTVDELSGEVTKIYPPSKKSTSGLKISIR